MRKIPLHSLARAHPAPCGRPCPIDARPVALKPLSRLWRKVRQGRRSPRAGGGAGARRAPGTGYCSRGAPVRGARMFGGGDRIRTGVSGFCRPLPYHLATPPQARGGRSIGAPRSTRQGAPPSGRTGPTSTAPDGRRRLIPIADFQEKRSGCLALRHVVPRKGNTDDTARSTPVPCLTGACSLLHYKLLSSPSHAPRRREVGAARQAASHAPSGGGECRCSRLRHRFKSTRTPGSDPIVAMSGSGSPDSRPRDEEPFRSRLLNFSRPKPPRPAQSGRSESLHTGA